jgi:hypothetical protein
VPAKVLLGPAFGFFTGRCAPDAAGYGCGSCVVDGVVLFLGDAFVAGMRCELLCFVVDDGLEGYLHRCALRSGGIGGCFSFLGGLFCCWVTGSRVGLVQCWLRRASRVQSVRHICGDEV